ncbi:MAG TPA: Fe-S oxidoreductase, partial [Actinomycetota bacterium]|nr:Fe-S oxidoreductase [Actinomycetota bacterium]
ATGCPFCNIMLSDGVTERHASEQMEVRDVAQILLESIDFHPESTVRAANGNGANGNGSYPATEAPEEMSDSPEGYPRPD